MIENIIIYYFSGTGNALYAAQCIAEYTKNKNINTTITSIDRSKPPKNVSFNDKTIVGFCFPTHGFNIIWIMLKFIIRFPVSKNTGIFLLNTRAGMKMYKLFIPGLSGIAQFLPMIILLFKGYKIKGLLPLDMPSNWISIHPGIKPKVVKSIIDRCKKITNKFTESIINNKRYIHPYVYIFLLLDIAIIPISVGYFIYGRFFLAKTFISSSDCNECRLCEQKCPTESITIIDNRPYWSIYCESCMRCINICPKKSIQTSHLLAVLILLISSSIPLSNYLYKLLYKSTNHVIFKIIDSLGNWGFNIILIMFLYFIFFWLMRFRIVNLLFTYTSLTKYWRHYKLN